MCAPAQVLESVGLADIAQADFVAWTAEWDHVVMVGRRGTNYVLVLARHDPDRWTLSTVIMRYDTRCVWARGQWSYDHAPTQDEITGILRLAFSLGGAERFSFSKAAK
jgi:hypothetical protein